MLVSCIGVVGLQPALATSSSDEVVADWNAIALAAAVAARHPGPVVVLDVAIVHAAVYDAVNSIDRRHVPYALSVPDTPADASQVAAAATAAYRALVSLFPSQEESLAAAYGQSLARVPDSDSKQQGISVGERAAAGILALRSNDGRFANVPYQPGTGPGAWIPTPPFFAPALVPWVARVTPFTLRSNDQFRVDPPPALSSTAYAEDYEEVRTMGAKFTDARTSEQTATARFFAEPPATAWNRTLQGIARESNGSVADDARLFALANLAAADAQISCWDSKYTYNYWRPVTAIRAGDTDGNPDTPADPTWEPLLVTPPFPEYSSGHTTFSGAVAQVLADFYGTDRFPFRMSSAPQFGGSGEERTYERFSDVVKEVIDGRIWAGSHFRTADTVGAAAGNRIGHWVTKNVAQPVFKAS